jgi:hypothetical protein
MQSFKKYIFKKDNWPVDKWGGVTLVSTLWNYSKCGVYTVESEAGC